MLNVIKSAIVAAGAAAMLAGAVPVQAQSASNFDVQSAQSWADRLVLCDVTAFLAGKPDLNANLMLVHRDDGRDDLLLPPDFVNGGQWYKEGYERLYWRMKRENKVDSAQLRNAQNTLGHDLVEAYRRDSVQAKPSFLRHQDSYCRSMARSEGEIIS